MSAFTRIASRYIVPATARTTTTGLRVAFDSEADGLLDITKVHCIAIADLDGDQIAAYGPEQIAAALEHMARAGYLTGTICTYDLPLLKRLYNWSPAPDCVVVDTQVAGRLILPNINDLDDKAAAMGDQALGKLRGRYSIEAWGQRLGIPKSGTEITDWSHWTPAMQERCAGDAMICKALWWFLAPDGYSQAALALEHRAAMVCAEISAAGAPFHADAAEQLHEQWTDGAGELAAQLQQLFPGVKLSSRKQIGALLEARGWVPERRTEKTKQPKIDDELLETIPHFTRSSPVWPSTCCSVAGSPSCRPAPSLAQAYRRRRSHPWQRRPHRHAAQPRQASGAESRRRSQIRKRAAHSQPNAGAVSGAGQGWVCVCRGPELAARSRLCPLLARL